MNRNETMMARYGLLQLSVSKLEKIIGQDELKKLTDSYQSCGSSHTYDPSEADLKAYTDWVADKISLEEAARRMGVSTASVYTRFAKIGKQRVK
jgi:hypothetical protein